jgi:ParB-like chromosome segregation protein Spo0J
VRNVIIDQHAPAPAQLPRREIVTEFHQIPLINIIVPESRRKVDPDAVKELAASIDRLGLQQPITVRKVVRRGVHWENELVAGRHRLEAARLLEHKSILARIITADDSKARLLEISENLHRSNMTTLERAEQIDEWRRLTAEKRGDQLGPPSGGQQPNDLGIKATARDLGVPKQEVQRSSKIASITYEAKEAAREAGLGDNQSALLKVADAEPEKQVEAVATIVKAKAEKAKAEKPKPAPKQAATPAQHAQNRAATMRSLSVFEATEIAATKLNSKRSTKPVEIEVDYTVVAEDEAEPAALSVSASPLNEDTLGSLREGWTSGAPTTPDSLFASILPRLVEMSEADVRAFSLLISQFMIDDRPIAKAA